MNGKSIHELFFIFTPAIMQLQKYSKFLFHHYNSRKTKPETVKFTNRQCPVLGNLQLLNLRTVFQTKRILTIWKTCWIYRQPHVPAKTLGFESPLGMPNLTRSSMISAQSANQKFQLQQMNVNVSSSRRPLSSPDIRQIGARQEGAR